MSIYRSIIIHTLSHSVRMSSANLGAHSNNNDVVHMRDQRNVKIGLFFEAESDSCES